MIEKKPRLVLIGGFLGSGKTSLMLALGEKLVSEGLHVAVVTNDQGEFLVDTAYARSRGLRTGEILGGCFCCNFADLVTILESFVEKEKPDIILAEPVGSCTDLAATVLGPMKLHHENLVELGPYIVLADGARMADEYKKLNLENPITPRETLVSHQLREASRIILSKDDLLSPAERKSALIRLEALVPLAEILPCSLPEERGLNTVIEWILNPETPEIPSSVDIDYSVYAAAEAELGWYNSECTLFSEKAFSPSNLAMNLILRLKTEFGEEAAHAKLILSTAKGSIKSSLAGGRIRADSGLQADVEVRKTRLTLNIRALREPGQIEETARKIIRGVCSEDGLTLSDYQSEALIPGAPEPTYRI